MIVKLSDDEDVLLRSQGLGGDSLHISRPVHDPKDEEIKLFLKTVR